MRIAGAHAMLRLRTALVATVILACGGKIATTPSDPISGPPPSNDSPPPAEPLPSNSSPTQSPAPRPQNSGPRKPPHVQCGASSVCEGTTPLCCIDDTSWAHCTDDSHIDGCFYLVACQASNECGAGELCCVVDDGQYTREKQTCVATDHCPQGEACTRNEDCASQYCVEGAIHQTNTSVCDEG
jgi:hypothetical protein